MPPPTTTLHPNRRQTLLLAAGAACGLVQAQSGPGGFWPLLRQGGCVVLMRHARVVLGNSSMGIREAPYYGTATVNVGPRQDGRTSNPHILHVPCQREAILDALEHAHSRRSLRPVREWGHGDSHVRFRRQLERKEIWDTPVQKAFRDIPVPPIPRAPLSSDPPPPSWPG